MYMPMHAGCFFVIHMNPVHPAVRPSVFGVLCKDHRESDETSLIRRLSVGRPAFEYGELAEIRVLLLHYLLTWSVPDSLGQILRKFKQLWQHRQFCDKSLRRRQVQKVSNPVSYIIEV